LRPEANSQQTAIEREIEKRFKKSSVAERDLKEEYGLICKADGGLKVHDDSGWRVAMGFGAETRQHV
jgi:hypothetical protein